MKKKTLRTAVCVLLAVTVLTAFAAMASGVGGQTDPLVTLSYLNDVFLGQMMDRVEEKLASRNSALKEEMARRMQETERELLLELGGGDASGSGGYAATYAAVTLADGQTLFGYAGCEVLHRTGSAVCVSAGGSTPGLLDTTGGGSINNGGKLLENHLYMMPAERGVAASGEVTLLVRGDYYVS